VVTQRRGCLVISRPDRNDVRIDTWRLDGASRRTGVASGSYDDKATVPGDLGGSGEGVVFVRAHRRRAKRQVDNLNVELSFVLNRPLNATHNGRNTTVTF